jgi:hypothetical protein
MKRLLPVVLVHLLFLAGPAIASRHIDFSIHKLGPGGSSNTLLVIGGIQGDEPGGFNAASLLVTHYKISKGSVWVVPNLNFISIIKRTRGVYGDLNRKFATLQTSDPEFKTIAKIKALILDERVDLILNLHDGSGFYRPVYLDRKRNPHRWGQSIIIDQERIASGSFGNLDEIAVKIVAAINRHVLSEEHSYRVKNTRTRLGDEEMAKTLTYYAICNLKPAFGVEVSKSFPTHKRTYYHLQALEAYMDLMGIEYERTFNLSANGVREAINRNVRLAFYDNRIFLDVSNARKRLGYIPLKRSSAMVFRPSNPLIAVVESGRGYRVFHGNRRITRIHPQYFEYDDSIETITMNIDGEEARVNFGEMVGVAKSFLVIPQKGYRVNVIGFKKATISNESGVRIRQNDIMRRFSIDKSGQIYRVEVYKQDKFSGMVLVNFSKNREDFVASGPSKVSLLEVSELRNPPSSEDSSIRAEQDSSLSR